MQDYTPAQRAAFAAAVKARLMELGQSQAWLARQLGITPQALGGWFITIPHPPKVFRLEDELGCPGRICPTLGYLRADAERPTFTFLDCVARDTTLDKTGAGALIAMYQALVDG